MQYRNKKGQFARYPRTGWVAPMLVLVVLFLIAFVNQNIGNAH